MKQLSRNNTQLILHGSLIRAMLSIAVPVVISSMLQTMYNLTDTYWLGKIGTEPLAAINLVTPMQNIVLNFGSGVTVAGAVMIAQYIGAGRADEAKRTANQIFVVAMGFALVCASVLAAFSPAIVGWLGAQEDLAMRVQAMHTALLEKFGLWFFAGAGLPCSQPRQLWESYEQARNAFRCMSRTHVFLPYAAIQKDTESWYYPIEISAKLLHFITTGNQQQVSEMFALIYRENIEERRLNVRLLAFLLSDLKNTLIKALFQITPSAAGSQTTFPELNQALQDAETFQELEACAITLCGFFVKAAEPSDPIPEIQRYLRENFSDPSLCLSNLSGLFNISESYLSHLFKDKTGENFSTYLENLRMDEAQRRLAEGSCSLSTLYVELGYTNPTTWRRAFKKRFGMTPSEMIGQSR